MRNQIECAGWLQNSCDDGPGMRSVLFLQGCSKNCKGCHNSKIKEPGKGVMMGIVALIELIERRCCNKKITISGGEPLEQLQELIQLMDCLKKKKYNICLYTGWDIKSIPKEVFQYVDYIKTGSFLEELISPNINFVGSSNQHMYQMQDNGELQEIDLFV